MVLYAAIQQRASSSVRPMTVKLTVWMTLDDADHSSESVQCDAPTFKFSFGLTIEWE